MGGRDADYLRRQVWAARWGVARAVALGLAVIVVGAGATRDATWRPLLLPGGAVLVAVLAVAALAGRRAARRGRRYRGGARGEDALARALAAGLGDEYTLYRNLRLPGWRADLDAVLIGPPGVVLLENKAYQGAFVLFGDRWYRAVGVDGEDLRPWHGSPTAQAARNGARLRSWLTRQGFAGVPVQPLVVLSSGEVRETRRAPSAPVVPLERVVATILRLPRARFATGDAAALAGALDALHAGGS